MAQGKEPLKKVTIRLYESDVSLINEIYEGGYGKPGLNQVIREVIRSWADQKLRRGNQQNETQSI